MLVSLVDCCFLLFWCVKEALAVLLCVFYGRQVLGLRVTQVVVPKMAVYVRDLRVSTKSKDMTTFKGI
jgi:hypothetical protein